MALKLYNTLSRKLEYFVPINDKQIGIYTCGPTVYNYPHIGNYRAYIAVDILKRYLQYVGFDVLHVKNITDVDDKTIRDSQKENTSLKDFTEFYTKEFFQDCKSLNIIPADVYPKATEHITEMVSLIEILIENGIAYKTETGDVYYSVQAFADYGKLSHVSLDALKDDASGRIKNDEYDKDNPQDFALWKAWSEEDGDVFWDPSTLLGTSTSLGKGRPGWHIECSAMSMKYLGSHFDIHTGGIDLVFPHHENEIAQSEACTHETFVNYWMHNEWLMVDGKKMSKSLGNFLTLRDLIEKGISPLAFRYLLLTSQYRTQTNFTLESVQAAETALKRLYTHFQELPDSSEMPDASYIEKCIGFMNEDLDTPKSIALLWELLKDNEISDEVKRATLLDLDMIFGLGLADLETEIIPENILELAEKRNKAREEKDFAKSDELRRKIEELGYEVKDTGTETKVSKV